ncbi:MAG TPA: imidazoleglycerol-phosphate dehydratase HisB [Opitutales bacterium]|nr:imidazoleglycerol-phosphate dehydratase HisB [Opitutales bacterium]
MAEERIAELRRDTKETKISLKLAIDGSGTAAVATGVPFLDHMLTLFAAHGLFDLSARAEGDIAVDYHHLVEDFGIALGSAFKQALGDKAGLTRYGFFYQPMDETLVRAVVDLGGRAMLVYDIDIPVVFVRDFNIGLFREFFQGFANSAGANVHIKLEYGQEPHHVAEAVFKGFARALDAACRIDPRRQGSLPSTKGLL